MEKHKIETSSDESSNEKKKIKGNNSDNRKESNDSGSSDKKLEGLKRKHVIEDTIPEQERKKQKENIPIGESIASWVMHDLTEMLERQNKIKTVEVKYKVDPFTLSELTFSERPDVLKKDSKREGKKEDVSEVTKYQKNNDGKKIPIDTINLENEGKKYEQAQMEIQELNQMAQKIEKLKLAQKEQEKYRLVKNEIQELSEVAQKIKELSKAAKEIQRLKQAAQSKNADIDTLKEQVELQATQYFQSSVDDFENIVRVSSLAEKTDVIIQAQEDMEKQIKAIEDNLNQRLADTKDRSKIKKAANDEISQFLTEHINAQNKHIEDLKQIFKDLGGKPKETNIKEKNKSLEQRDQNFDNLEKEQNSLDSEIMDLIHGIPSYDASGSYEYDNVGYQSSEEQKREDLIWEHGNLEELVEKAKTALGENYKSIKRAESILGEYDAFQNRLSMIQDKDEIIELIEGFIVKHANTDAILCKDFKMITGIELDIDNINIEMDIEVKNKDLKIECSSTAERSERVRLQDQLQQEIQTAQRQLNAFTFYEANSNNIWLAALEASGMTQTSFEARRDDVETAKTRLGENTSLNRLSESIQILQDTNRKIQLIEVAMQEKLSTPEGKIAGKQPMSKRGMARLRKRKWDDR